MAAVAVAVAVAAVAAAAAAVAAAAFGDAEGAAAAAGAVGAAGSFRCFLHSTPNGSSLCSARLRPHLHGCVHLPWTANVAVPLILPCPGPDFRAPHPLQTLLSGGRVAAGAGSWCGGKL